MEAELWSFLWAVESISSLRYERVVFESSSYLAGEAILRPSLFPQFNDMLQDIRDKLSFFRLWTVAFAHIEGNRCAEAIATSVTRDHKYSSYIAHAGPFWLASELQEEALGGRSMIQDALHTVTASCRLVRILHVTGFSLRF
ncbi:hypothetical protein HID58_079233 [Brassica napus]|uniref:RNase H type-1 domain-containing protein n=2 Tax=Brassica TaxID=3705 RepID=A0ABQ7Y1F8_BRANA|nr:hypothetical protein HID58_079233 [Brassica napus]